MLKDPTLAQLRCNHLNRNFAEIFRSQFVLSRNSQLHFEGWLSTACGEWTFYHGRGARISKLMDKDGHSVGILVGIGITQRYEIIRGNFRLPTSLGSSSFLDEVESYFNSVAGRYAAILITPYAERIYLDPVADMGLVYDPETKTVASSLFLAIDRKIRPNPRFGIGQILRGKGNFSLQNTADENVKRALPNHYLDLENFVCRRHWPRGNEHFDSEPSELPFIIDEIAERLGNNFGALVKKFPCSVPITGGRDSRNLIACGREHLDRVEEFFTYRFHNPSRVDSRIGQSIVRDLNLPFKNFYRVDPVKNQKSDFLLKTGYSGVRAELGALSSQLNLPEGHAILRSNIMELLRANQWRAKFAEGKFSDFHGVRRLRIRPGINIPADYKIWSSDYSNWVETLPENSRGRIYDFGFLEHLLPNTQGAYFHGFSDVFFVCPFADRRLIELAIRIPVLTRMSDVPNKKLLEATLPTLAKYPFN